MWAVVQKYVFWTITKLFSVSETAKTCTSEKGTVVSHLFIPWVKCGSVSLFFLVFFFWYPFCEIKLAAC